MLQETHISDELQMAQRVTIIGYMITLAMNLSSMLESI